MSRTPTVAGSRIAARIYEALASNGFVTTKSLATWLGESREAVIGGFVELEAAGIKLHREYGCTGGASLAPRAKRAA